MAYVYKVLFWTIIVVAYIPALIIDGANKAAVWCYRKERDAKGLPNRY